MKTLLRTFCLLNVAIGLAGAAENPVPPEPGPGNSGLRLRLAVAPRAESDKNGYDVSVDVLNTSDRPITLRAGWRGDDDKGDLKDYLEAAIHIECVPAIAPWSGQVVDRQRTLPQPELVLEPGKTFSARWRTDAKRLKNRVTSPIEVQNPEFPFPGMYSVHATLKIHKDGRPVLLRSNEQLVTVGGSRTTPQHTYGTLLGVDGERKIATLNLGSLHKVRAGDEFMVRSGMTDFWKLTLTQVELEFSTGQLEPLTRLGPNSMNPNPRLPERNHGATLILK